MASSTKVKLILILFSAILFLTACGKKAYLPEGATLPTYPPNPAAMNPAEPPPQ